MFALGILALLMVFSSPRLASSNQEVPKPTPKHPLPLADKSHHPVGPGRVVIFSQDKRRPGNEDDVRDILRVFEKNGTKVSDYRNLSKAEIMDKLNELREEEDKNFCYLMMFILSHGFIEKLIIEDTGTMIGDINVQYIIDCNGEPVPIQIFKDFLEKSCPKPFERLPRVGIGQFCRGKEKNRMVKTKSENLSLKAVTDDVEEAPLADAVALDPHGKMPLVKCKFRKFDDRPKHGDFAFIYATLEEFKAVRGPFIKTLCQVIESNPDSSFMDQMLKVQTTVGDMEITVAGVEGLCQVGAIESALSLPFYLGLHDRKSNSSKF